MLLEDRIFERRPGNLVSAETEGGSQGQSGRSGGSTRRIAGPLRGTEKGRQQESALHQCNMPYVQLRVAGNLTKEQKQEIAAQFTKTLEDVAGKPPAATYIVIEEVSRENWAKGGKLLSDS